MRYAILGTTQAHRDDRTSVELGGARLRALLAALALSPGRLCTTGALIADIWDTDPPADEHGALQALVGRLRRALGREAVASAPGGYRLVADPDDVDLHRFERLAEEGARALADGAPDRAADLLGTALALWRGPALADLPGGVAAATRAEARRLDARRARFAAELALGRAAQVLPALTELCDAHRLDEPLHALRIRALRDAGRPAEALAAYEAIRAEIANRLGADPGPTLRALHAALLTPEPTPPAAFATPTTPAVPAPPAGPGAPGALAGPATPDVPGVPAAPGSAGPVGSAAPAAGAGSAVPGVFAAPAEPVPPATPAAGDATPAGPGATAGSAAPAAGAGSAVPGAFAAPAEPVPPATPAAGDATPAGPGATAGPAAPAAGAGPAVPGAFAAPTAPGGAAAPGPTAAPGSTAAPAAPGAPAAGAATPAAPAVPGASPDPAAPAAPASPPPPAGPPGGGNLRARLTSFVGREAELEALRTDLTGHRLVTLLGPGGAGKTRLSQEAAEAVGAAWPDGVWLAELAPVDDPETVPETVLTALGGRETVIRGTAAEGLRAAADPATHDPLTRLVEHCEPRRMLIVLDNCEHLVEAAARLADTLLARCPGVTVLATSREPLAVPGELVRPVEPLPDPVALRLLQDRGAAARRGFRTEDDPGACAEICRRLDGLPLAIELAAARLRLLNPRQLADRLDDRFRLLTSGSRTVLPRQQTLRAVVDWSWDLLDTRERTVLRRLSVFAGGCDLSAAEAVCADSEPPAPAEPADALADAVDPRDVTALLGSLVDKSLVVAAPGATGEMRYGLLETVAEYAGERLDEAGERAAAERRHLVAYRELARTADPLLRGPAQRDWLDRLESEHENLRTALRRAVAARDEQEALCLVLSLGWFWNLRGHRADARHWATAAAELGPNPFALPVNPAPPLYAGCIDAPPPMTPELLDEARRGVRLFALANIEGDLQFMSNDTARRELEGIVVAYRAGLPQTCRIPGLLWFFAVIITGEFGLLREMADTTVRTCRELGYTWELGFTLQLRSKLLNERRSGYQGATRDADESLEIFLRLGDAWGAAEALSGRGEVREQAGDGAAAAEDYRAAIRCAQELGAHEQVVLLRSRLAGLYVEFGDEEEAAEGERMLREVVDRGLQAGAEALSYARLHLAQRYGVTGRVAEARTQLTALHTEFEVRALNLFQGVAEGMLAWLDLLERRPGDALVRVRAALAKTADRMTDLVAPFIPVAQLLTGAEALGELGGAERADTAARLVGAYDGLRGSLHHRRNSTERASRERTEAAARAALGDTAYERAYGEGGGLTLEEAIALV
ncbi:AfsR/SARP family transcriptional regulator [Streptomyces sp. NA02950]|uniref:AfsR/SARP family transcriptional regulator n=1 Tax=Streptomyces sp. NA02950 TaxID=2742137 RepID=UPI001599C46A|nr:BTAD domain-containing putative transcriptional regulator [Streptomyces sp. NA02950]QKV95311.1 AfsR/SARP family transcriptional regulator [Streptomyces sp. NA02950]